MTSPKKKKAPKKTRAVERGPSAANVIFAELEAMSRGEQEEVVQQILDWAYEQDIPV